MGHRQAAGGQTGLLLAEADGERQAESVGRQYAGRVGLLFRAEDFEAAWQRMLDHGVDFVGKPRDEPYGRVAVFLDVARNRWDLLGPRAPESGPAYCRWLCDPGDLVDHPIRIGDTVRRARTENTALVQRVLCVLEEAGAAWAPRGLGIDELGREVVSWIPGDTATLGGEIDLVALAGIVRQLHDLTDGMVDGFDCVIHGDLQPRNVVVRDGAPVGLIDWEQARPGRRIEDVAKLCWSFIEPTPHSDPVEVGRQWRYLAAAYGLEPADVLLPTVVAQILACANDIEREAARHSVRHQALAARGDHLALRAMHRWVVASERTLQRSIGG